jgi:hypothetical protein
MDVERNLKIIFEILYRIMPGIIIIVAALVIYFFFNAELFKTLAKLLVPLVLFASGLAGSYAFRKRKQKKLVYDNGRPEVTITINYFTLFWHDALVFLTPSAILIAAYWFKGSVGYFDLLSAALAMTGLYLSELIYKRKIV